MSANYSDRSLKTSEFIKGGGDAGCEQPGNAQVELIYSPVFRSAVRPFKPKSVFGQYRSLPRKPGFVSSPVKGTTTDVKFRSSTTPRKVKKASSMEDLTPESRKKQVPTRVKRTMSLTPATMGGNQSVVDPLANTKLLASRRIFQALILNAWRKRRSYVAILITEKDNCSHEVKNLNLQITLLKSLLESEKERSNKSAVQLKEVTAMMDVVTEELHVVRKDKEELHMKLACQDLHHDDLEAKFNHVKNELQVAKVENFELTNRLQCSEEEASSLNEKNADLLVKVESQNDTMVSRAELIKSLQIAKADLEERLSVQLTTLLTSRQETDEALKSVNRLQEELARKNGELSAVEAINKELLDKIRSLLQEMREQNIEMEDLKARLIDNELEMKSNSWSSQLRNVVTLMAHLVSRVVLLTTN